MFKRTSTGWLILQAAMLAAAVYGQTATPKIRYITLDEAQPVIAEAGEKAPAGISTTASAADFDRWAEKTDREIRSRLEQGDEDSIVNLLLFGTSFTKEPRMTESQMAQLASNTGGANTAAFQQVLQARLDDLLTALAAPGKNERLSFAKDVIIRKVGTAPNTAAGKKAITVFLLDNLRRVLGESAGFADLVEQAKRNREDVFVVRSQMFSRRGLSSDTSLKPDLAIDKAIRDLAAKGLVKSVRRVAIVGPGLDFTDKDEGYDFYPPQTLQPFAVIESLLRAKLADAGLQVDTYDLSPKVNRHIAEFRQMAAAGRSYAIQLPLNTERNWTPEFVKYWQDFGTTIGSPAPAADAISGTRVRAVKIKSQFLAIIRPFDVNIVLQHPVLADADRYDLVIGTNIFVYYDPFYQALAMRNLEKMMKPGAILLSNNALVEFPFTPIHSVGYSKMIYSDRVADGDAIVWYKRDTK